MTSNMLPGTVVFEVQRWGGVFSYTPIGLFSSRDNAQRFIDDQHYPQDFKIEERQLDRVPGWRAAIGAIPHVEGRPSSEEVIRRGRE